MLIAPACLLLLFPCFPEPEHLRTAWALCGAAALLGGAFTVSSVSTIVVIAQSLGGVGMIYAATIAYSAAQLMLASVIAVTGNAPAPAFHMKGAVLIGVYAMLRLTETAPIRVTDAMRRRP